MKLFLYILLFFFGLTCVAQNQQILQKLENSYPVETLQDFKALRPAIEKLASPKKDGLLWSPKLLKTLKSGKDWAEANGDSQQKLLAQYYLLMYFDNHLDDNQVITIGKKLLMRPKFMEMPESTHALSALNASYRRKGFYRQQLNILNSLIEQNKKFGYTVLPNTYGYYNELAIVYYNLGQYTLARNNFTKQAKMFKNGNDLFRTSSMLNNIGLTYAHQQKPDSALVFYKKALGLIAGKPINDDYYTTEYIDHFGNVIKANIANIKIEQGKFSDAESILKNELTSSKAVKEPSTTAQTYQDLANLYYLKEQFHLAKIYNDSTLIFEKKYPNPKNREKAYLLRAKIALKQNRNKSALHYFNRSIVLKDSLTKEKEEKNFSEATVKFNFVKTQEALEKNKNLLQEKEKANLIQLIFLCVVALLTIVIGGLFFRTKKANTLIAKQKNALTKGLKEKEIMLDEIHHRIKNNLQVISGILELQREKVDSEESAKIFGESQEYLQSMTLIHELLYQQEGVTKLDMEVYLKRLGHLLIGHYQNITVEYKVLASDIYMKVGKATPLSLIICELITNSLKHAFTKKGTITIVLSKNTNEYVLDYRDDGKGFEPENIKESNSMGLYLISMLAEDLEGKLNYQSNEGFHLTLNFES